MADFEILSGRKKIEAVRGTRRMSGREHQRRAEGRRCVGAGRDSGGVVFLNRYEAFRLNVSRRTHTNCDRLLGPKLERRIRNFVRPPFSSLRLCSREQTPFPRCRARASSFQLSILGVEFKGGNSGRKM